jgi:hypothetical protein
MMSHRIADCPLAADRDDRRALAAALRTDDIDTAIEIGLLSYIASHERVGVDRDKICEECAGDEHIILTARDERLRALAARERFRAREARLANRAELRAQKRSAAANTRTATAPDKPDASLPPAAAAALARAKAKAAGRA